MSKLWLSKDLGFPIDCVTQTFAILAIKGAGKTHTGVVMVEEMFEKGQQVVIADPLGVWWGLRSTGDGKSAGYPVVIFGGDHADLPLDENAGELIAVSVVEHGFSAILDFSHFRKHQQTKFMCMFAETLYRKNRKALHFMIDEADAFAPQRPMHDQARMLGALEDIVRRGRARGIGCTLISQRPAVLNKNVLTQIECLIVLRILAPQDRKAIEEWLELNVEDKIRKDMLVSLATLQKGEAWVWSPSWLQTFQRIQVRARGTFDSSATPKANQVKAQPKVLAPVNLEILGEQIKGLSEKAKESDPKLLKAEVVRLRNEISRLEKAKSRVPTSAGVVKRVEVPVVKSTQLTQLDRAVNLLVKAVGHAQEVTLSLQKFLAQARQLKPGVPNPKPLIIETAKSILDRQTLPARDGDIHLRKGELQILRMLAQSHPIRRSRSQVGTLCGFAPTGGTFLTYLSVLKKAGFIDEGNDGLAATENGIAHLGDDVPPIPTTSEEIQQQWYAKLRTGEREMLRHLVSIYPSETTREALAEAVNMEPKGGTYLTYLSTLRRNKLVDDSGPGGLIKASSSLFIS